jgi:hypothetical protein
MNIEYRTRNFQYPIIGFYSFWEHLKTENSFFSIHYSLLMILALLTFPSCSAKTSPPPTTDSSAYELIKSIDIKSKWIATDKLQQL